MCPFHGFTRIYHSTERIVVLCVRTVYLSSKNCGFKFELCLGEYVLSKNMRKVWIFCKKATIILATSMLTSRYQTILNANKFKNK